MAQYVAEGAHVTLVTCTLGEEGEVLVPELAHLAADQDDQLGQHRIGELADRDGGARRHATTASSAARAASATPG